MLRTPPTIEEAILISLVEKLKAGDVQVIEKIVLSHVQIAQQLAVNWAKRVHAPIDEIEAEALYLLTVAVTAAITGLQDNNIGPYINTYINRGLLNFCYRTRRISASYDKLKKNKIAHVPLFISFNAESVFKDFEVEDPIMIDRKGISNNNMLDMLQILTDVLVDDRERAIVRLRMSGDVDREIAIKLGVSDERIRQIRADIETRFFKEFLCDVPNTSVPPVSNSTEEIEMNTTSAISLTQDLRVTHKPSP